MVTGNSTAKSSTSRYAAGVGHHWTQDIRNGVEGSYVQNVSPKRPRGY